MCWPSGPSGWPVTAADALLGVYFLDVGQGDATFIVAPERKAVVLVDCNDAFVARRLLEDHHIERLDAVVVTHLDIDHVRGIMPLVKGWLDSGKTLDRIYITRDRFRDDVGHNAARLLRYVLDLETNGRIALFAPSREVDAKNIAHGTDWSIDLVAPDYATTLDAQVRERTEPNGLSAIVSVKRAGQVVLVGGDATFSSWERLAAEEVRAHVVRTSHHGGDILAGASRWTTYGQLYDAIQPSIAVFSAGTHNGHGHPLRAHLQAPRCVKLCTQLTPQCHAEVVGVRDRAVDHVGRVEFPYRHRVAVAGRDRKTEAPCAGSIAVFIDGKGQLDREPPDKGWHDNFVRSLGSPMCR